VIEYKGLLIRPVLEDVLEARYEAAGQDSSYLFRCGQADRQHTHATHKHTCARVGPGQPQHNCSIRNVVALLLCAGQRQLPQEEVLLLCRAQVLTTPRRLLLLPSSFVLA
jgi:hypothetical protein